MNALLEAIPEQARILVLIGMVLGSIMYGVTGGFAPDRFTGDQGDALAAQIVGTDSRVELLQVRIGGIETAVKELRSDMRSIGNRLSKLPPKELTSDIAKLKAQMDHVIKEHDMVLYRGRKQQ